jgi:hypothetical protein
MRRETHGARTNLKAATARLWQTATHARRGSFAAHVQVYESAPAIT